MATEHRSNLFVSNKNLFDFTNGCFAINNLIKSYQPDDLHLIMQEILQILQEEIIDDCSKIHIKRLIQFVKEMDKAFLKSKLAVSEF